MISDANQSPQSWKFGRTRRRGILTTGIVAMLCLCASASANARILHVVVVRTSFTGDTRAHVYSAADLQASVRDQATYLHNLTYGQMELSEQVFSVTLSADLTVDSTNASAVPLLGPAVSAVESEPGGTAALSSADVVALVVPPSPGGFYDYQWPISVSGRSRTVGLVYLPETGTDPLGPSSNVEWGYWMQEFLHDVQDHDRRMLGHPAGYADGNDLMDSCYPCGLGLFDLASNDIVGHNLGVLPGLIPDSHVTVVDATGTHPLDVVRNLEPVDWGGGDPSAPAFGQPQQGMKILLDDVSWPTGPGSVFRTSHYYLLERHTRSGPEIYGTPPRLMSEGVHVVQVFESRVDNNGSGGLTPHPVDELTPCQQAPAGQRCAGLSGEGSSTDACTASQPHQNVDFCYPFSLWQPGTTFHGDDGINVSLRAADFPYSRATRTEVTRTATTSHPDVFIIPWETSPMNTAETVDIWVDSSCNGYEFRGLGSAGFVPSNPRPLRYGRRRASKATQRTVIGNGDDPCVNHNNRVYAEIHNAGGAAATDPRVNFQVGALGTDGKLHYTDLGTAPAPTIPAHGETAVYADWTPRFGDSTTPYTGLPTTIRVTVDPGPNATSLNNFADENIVEYDTGSVYQPRAGVPVVPLPANSPLPGRLSLTVQPKTAARIPLGSADGLQLPPGGSGGVLPISVNVPKHMRPGAVRELRVRGRELTFGVESPLPFGYPTRMLHGESSDADSLGVFVRAVARSSLMLKTRIRSARVIVEGQLRPSTRTVIAIDELSKAGGKSRKAKLLRTILVRTDARGQFRTTLRRPRAAYVLHAFWQGDLRHGPTASWPMSSPPRLRPPTILKGQFRPTLTSTPERLGMTCPQSVTVGQAAAITGQLAADAAGAVVFVRFSSANGDTVLQAPVGLDGRWNISSPLGAPGNWHITASYFGDLGHAPATPASCDVRATATTTLTLACPGKASLKGALTTSGVLSPAVAGAVVTITYTNPMGSIADQATVDATGAFTDTTNLGTSGNWTSQASYAGDASHTSSLSQACATTVS